VGSLPRSPSAISLFLPRPVVASVAGVARIIGFAQALQGLHINYKRLQEAVVCSELTYHL